MPSFNIYVPSYRRYDQIKTNNFFEYCTYVVRKSEEENYRNAGITNIWSIEDEKINSVNKVKNYIIDNSKEDVICIVDDDVKQILYRLDSIEKLYDKTIITSEIERLAQVLYDMGVGYFAVPSDSNVKYYDRPFKFVGVNGWLTMYNKSALKSRLNNELKFLSDIEFQLNELMKNRIVIIPNYFCVVCDIDTNKGGSNDDKKLNEFEIENEIVSQKWGCYYRKANGNSAGSLRVKR